ncbi:hypothetical protein HDU76_008103, partial [Blyttiomyces sp. JEL0837]
MRVSPANIIAATAAAATMVSMTIAAPLDQTPIDLANLQVRDIAQLEKRGLVEDLIQTLFHMNTTTFGNLVKAMFTEEAAELKAAVTCDVCKGGVAAFADALVFESAISAVANWACTSFNLIKPSSRCQGLIAEFLPWAKEVFRDPKFTSSSRQQLCHSLAHLCPANPITTAKLTFPSAKPASYPFPQPKRQNLKYVVHLSDFHLDPQYVVGAEGACSGFLCCRSDSTNPANVTRPCSPYGDFGADVPQALAVSALKFIPTVVPKIDFMILTGDLVPHNLWETTTKNVFDALDTAVGLIKSNLPGVAVYPSVGNHDTSPTNYFAPTTFASYLSTSQFGPSFTATKDALAHLSGLFNSWLPADAIANFQKAGNYIVRPWAGFKIISFNTNYCYADDLYTYLLGGVTDPDNVLSWVISELAASEAANEKVWIIGHIPPGTTDCVEDFSHLFYQIVDRYSPKTLTGLFYGHVHKDQFQVFYSIGSETNPTAANAINTAYVSPSLTPYTSLNPGFRIYTVDADTTQVLEATTYIANLNNVNSWSTTGPQWELEYNASASYKSAFNQTEGWLSPAFWHRVTANIQGNVDNALNVYRKFEVKSSGLEGACDAACQKKVVCLVRAGKSEL